MAQNFVKLRHFCEYWSRSPFLGSSLFLGSTARTWAGYTSSFASQRALLANSWGFSWLFLNLLFLKFTASFFTVRQSSLDLAEPAFPWFPCPGSLYKGEDHRLFPFMIPAIQKAELKEKFLYTLGWQAGPLQFNKMVLLQENDPLVNWLCSLQVMGKNPLTFWN